MKISNKKSGAILVMTALLSTFILGITALVVDIGYLYYKRNDLQTAVNAAWLAGNDRLLKLKDINPTLSHENKENIKSHIFEVMEYNGFDLSGENRILVTIENDKDLQIEAQSHAGLFFAKVIHADSTTVSASRIEERPESNSADILPIVMHHGVIKWVKNQFNYSPFTQENGFVPGNEYIIKPGQRSDKVVLCQGITNFKSNEYLNSDNYTKLLNFGYTKPLEINDRISLTSFCFPKETEEIIKNRTSAQENNKKVIIPIISITEDALKHYSFDDPKQLLIYLLNVLEQENTPTGKIYENTIKIIGFAEFELVSPENYTRTGNNYAQGDNGSLGDYFPGQIRGKFLRYIVNPNEIQ